MNHTSHQKQSAALPLEVAFGARQLGAFEDPRLILDPSRSLVAYIVRTPPDVSSDGDPRFLPNGVPGSVPGQRLHIADIETGETTAVGPDGAASWRPSWSPDGKHVAFYSDHGGVAQLWVYNLASDECGRVCETRIKAKLWAGDEPQWSRDGSELFVPLVPETGDPFDESTGDTDGMSADRPNVTVFRSGVPATLDADAALRWEDHFRRDNLAAIGAIRLDNGSVRTVVRSDASPPPSVMQVAPSGKWLSYLSVYRQKVLDDEVSSQVFHDLAVVPAEGGEIATLAAGFKVPAHDYYLSSYIWHPSKDQLFWIRDGQLWTSELDLTAGDPRQLAPDLGEFTIAPLKVTRDGTAVIAGLDPLDLRDYRDPYPRKLAVVPLDGRRPRTLAIPDGLLLEDLTASDSSTVWEPVTGTLTILGKDLASARSVLLRIDSSTGAASTVWSGLAKIRVAGASLDHHSLIAGFEDLNTPADVFAFSADFQRLRRVTTVEPRLEEISFGPVETFETRVPHYDGALVSATTAVMLPPGATRGDRLPAVMFFYPGGRVSRSAAEFGGGAPSTIPVSAFTTRGYAVLLAEAPIGPVGEPGNPLEELAAVLVPQVYHAAELGYMDLARVAIAGQSYGGYGAAGTVSATNIFAAAIAINGVYDLASHHSKLVLEHGSNSFSWAETGQGRMGTHPWGDMHRYLANSPYYRADRIRTPLLLIQGASDPVCPATEAGKMFHALKRLDRPVELAVYSGEGHAPVTWSRVNAVDATQRMLDFLDHHLGSND